MKLFRRMLWELPRAVFLLVISIAISGAAHADGFDVARLMQLLAEAPAAAVSFNEKKYSSLLSEPVLSSGTLLFRRPDFVEKNIEAPRRERYRFSGDELLVLRNGAERRIPLSSQPMLSAFAASLRGILGGNLALLREHYQLSLQGDEASWGLDLTPNDAEGRRYVQRMAVSGRGGRIHQIEVHESSGDRSVLEVRSSKP